MMRDDKPATVLGEIYEQVTKFSGTEKFSDDVTLLIADLQ
jgi:serine phosphatase RsbU (regulator of sigma subunit)